MWLRALFLLDRLKPSNPPDGLWRGDEASSAYLFQSTLPLKGRWSATTMSWHTQKCYRDHSDKANTYYLTPRFAYSPHQAPTMLSEDCWAGWPGLPTAFPRRLLPIRESSVITSFSISAIDLFSNFIKPSTRGITFSPRSVLEVSVFWKSSNFDNEILCKPEHAHSMFYHHMVKFSPPSNLINSVYKFLGMPP